MARLHVDQIDSHTRVIEALTARIEEAMVPFRDAREALSKYLKAALGIAAMSAARSRNTYLAARDHRLAARRGPKIAFVAVEHSILTAADARPCGQLRSILGEVKSTQIGVLVQRADRPVVTGGHLLVRPVWSRPLSPDHTLKRSRWCRRHEQLAHTATTGHRGHIQ
ncbi:hypothetical protein GCM10027038_11720 [Arthrobacter bambusae]|uniref:hypothetical protein n=1 Tax=Arthrobacter sp. NPDC058127 TaxID=3346351 RepID=UPI0036E19FDE